MEKQMNAKEATFLLLDRMKEGETFTGASLAIKVRDKTGNMYYAATVLRHVREYRQRTGRRIVNIDNNKSKYEVIG